MKATTPEHAMKFNKKYVLMLPFYRSKLETLLQELAHCSSRPRSHYRKISSSTSDRRYSSYLDVISLTAHNITGVKFLYECVMGLRRHEGQGCILADEMYVFNLSACMSLLIFRLQGSGENPSGLFVYSLLFPLGNTLYRRSLLCGHSSVSSLSCLCVTISKSATEQNPYIGAGPVIGKALIVCPVSLVNVRFYSSVMLAIF
jgi:hypothetical protein